jgi:hypothetical protein
MTTGWPQSGAVRREWRRKMPDELRFARQCIENVRYGMSESVGLNDGNASYGQWIAGMMTGKTAD